MDNKNDNNIGLNCVRSERLPQLRHQLTSHAITRSMLHIMDEEFAGHLLHQSSLWDNEELLTDLLSGEQLKYLNSTDSKGRTALHASVCCDSESCTRILLINGADPNIGQVNDPQNNIIRKNPLHIAAENGNPIIVKLLLEHKADVLAKDGNGFTAMDIAEQAGHFNVMQLLRNAVDELESVRQELYDLLCNACNKGNTNQVKQILNKSGKDAEIIVNNTHNGCNTLLFKACQDGFKDIVELLISKGADGRIHPVTKYSPLYIAAYLGRKEIVEIVLNHFPDLVNVSTVEKWLPIQAAAINNHLHIIELLLNFNYPKDILQTFHDKNKQYEYYMPFDINAQDVTGQTVLYVTALVGNQRLIDFLLNFKVTAIRLDSNNTNEVNSDSSLKSDKNSISGDDPKDRNCDPNNSSPVKRKSSSIQKIIDKLSPTSGDIIYSKNRSDEDSCPQTKQSTIYPILLDIYCNNNTETALHAAVKKKHYSIASALLSRGSNPNLIIYINGEDRTHSEETTSTSLREACRNRDASMVDLLIRYGARDDDCFALKVASTNGDNHLMAKILSLKSHPDPEFKINKKSLQFNTGSGAVGFVGSVTFSSMFPTTPVMINWHSLKGLTQIRKQWLIDAAVAHNIKLKLNIQNQVTAITAITRLDLSNNGLTDVPLCIFQMHSLKILNLSQNKLETLPETDSQLLSPTNPTKSGISKMRKSKSHSSALCSNNSSNQLNGWVLPCLEEIYLQDNHLECITASIFELPALQLIDLSNNKLHSLPYKFWTAPKLREINLSLNLLRDLPSRPNSTSVTLSPLHNTNKKSSKSKLKNSDSSPQSQSIVHIEDIDEDFSTDKAFRANSNLHQKDLNHVNLWSQSVEVVAASRNDDESDAQQQCKLVSLNLSHNGFQRLPATLSCLALNLTRLNLSYNCLQSLGSIKSYPVNLKHVDLSHNQISDWFRVDFGDKTNHLEPTTCYCDFKQSSSPKSTSISLKPSKSNTICVHKQHNRLDNLRTLILANNKLTQINISTDEKDSYEEFETLDALTKGGKYNKLLFPNLSMLDVCNNIISEVPSNISDLTNLSVLNLSGNKDICYLPPEMGLLNKLWNLSTRGCNLNEPLKTMIESKKYKTMDIIGYLKSILENAKPYARMKLMIVGVQGIGKTSLLEHLRQEGSGTYKRKPPEHWGKRMGNKNLNMKTPRGITLSTVGVDVCDWTYEKRIRGQSSFGAVSFRTWDFGGQKEYYATHQYFLSKRSLYLVVWKITDGEKGVDGIFQWLVNIQARAPNSPVIIVGTHYDQIREYFPPFYSEELQQNIRERFINVVDPDKCGLPRVIDSIEVSIKTKHNIKLLCNIIYDTVFDLRCPGSKERLLEQKVPATYLALEDVVSYLALERRLQGKDPVLRLEQYKTAVIEEMMNRYGMTFRDIAELHQATIFLHENGVLLHYEDSTLKDLYFLDPQWLCDMLAHVVTIREINPYARNGIMKTDDLRQLFKLSKCAPTDCQTYLLNLLNKFEVALTWDSRTLLIPSLLPSEESLRAGLPGCDVRIPVRSRSWALRKSYQNQNVLSPSSIKIHFQNQTLFEATKRPAFLSLDEIQISVPPQEKPELAELPKRQPQCLVTVVNRPTNAIHRLLVMTYFPSGFWSRLMARILADDSIIEIIRTYFVIPQKAQSDPILLSLFNSKAEWLCWQTGMALKHFETFLIRVKEVFSHLPSNPYDYYHMKFLLQLEGQWKDVQICKSSLLEIYLPNQSLLVQTRDSEGVTKSYSIEPKQELVARLLVIVVDHMDTLLEDWYPTLGTRFVHTSEGKFLVSRLVPCPPCLISQSSYPNVSSPTFSSNIASNQNKSPDDIEWQMIDFYSDGIKRNAGSSDSRDSGMGRESHDSSRFSSVEGIQYSSSLNNQICDRNYSEEIAAIYSFMVEECILSVYEQKSLSCPLHGNLVMQSIAPDTVFFDLGDHNLVKPETIRYGKLLGRGAFGFVFRASVKQPAINTVLDVAMKMLQPVDPGYGARKSDTVAFKAANNKWERDPMQYACKAYCTARQELNILLTIRHPHIVPLVGFCTKPLSLILQLAPMGSLDNMIKNYRRSGTQFNVLVLQKIILQIAKALEYLHQQHIIYRDLKSENVLVWEIPQQFQHITALEGPNVDIKLADYGISRPSLPSGTKGFGGTEGFMAPEIMRYNGEEEYTEKVDCFSFGMFMYELLTLHLPFENQECVKEHMLEGGRPPLTQRDLVYPSYFIDLMTLCWSQQPKDRPSISQIVSIVSAPEFTNLLDVISLNENYALLSAAAFKLNDKCLQVCLSRIGKQTDVITSNGFNWTDYHTIAELDNITVMSICLVNSDVWLGDSKNNIRIYSLENYKETSIFELDLDDNTPTAVRCMCFASAINQVAISSSSGRLWMCNISTLTLKEIGNNGIPFLCVVNVDKLSQNENTEDCELWCGQSEGNISIITLSQSMIKSQHIVSHYGDDPNEWRTPINERYDVFQLSALSPYVWSYLYPGCIVWQWDVHNRTILTKLDCSKLAPCSESLMSISIEEHLSPGSCQVTAMAILEEQFELYIGTTWGCIIIVEANTMRPITVFRPYEEEVKAIIPFKSLKTDKSLNCNLENESHESLNESSSADYFMATIGKGYRNLLSRFMHLDNKSITQKGLHSILWSTKNWALN